MYSNEGQITVNKCSPSLNLVASPDSPQTYPGSVVLAATLTGADNNANKPISFTIYDGTNTIVETAATNQDGVATYTLTGSNAGNYTFEAKFDGDSENNAANTSITYDINKADQTISFTDIDEVSGSPSDASPSSGTSSTSGKAAATRDNMIFPLIILMAASLSLLFVAKKKYRK